MALVAAGKPRWDSVVLISIERMTALVAIIESGSFSGAARRTGKTPSAVSRIIQHFELDLGVELFERVDGRPPNPTDAARRLYLQAVEILPRLEILEKSAHEARAGVEPRLVLAVHGMAFNQRLEDALRRLVQVYPALELVLLDPDSFALDQALINGDVDLVLMPATHTPTRAVSYHRFAVMEWCFVAGSGHPLGRIRGELTEADLLSHTQLLPAASDVITPEMREAMRVGPRQISCQRLVQIMELLRMGLGYAFLPRHAVIQGLDTGQLCELQLESVAGGLSAWDVEVRWTHLGPAGQWLLDQLLE